MDNWMFRIARALCKSGLELEGPPYTREDQGFLNMVLIKPSALRDMPSRLKKTEEQSVCNAGTGHVGKQVSILNIIGGLELGRLKDGGLTAIVGAGIGYRWGATCVRWMPARVDTQPGERTMATTRS
jgi:hypothetical protein